MAASKWLRCFRRKPKQRVSAAPRLIGEICHSLTNEIAAKTQLSLSMRGEIGALIIDAMHNCYELGTREGSNGRD
jgi:hypothetical protein